MVPARLAAHPPSETHTQAQIQPPNNNNNNDDDDAGSGNRRSCLGFDSHLVHTPQQTHPGALLRLIGGQADIAIAAHDHEGIFQL
jgi:hypothetical protein